MISRIRGYLGAAWRWSLFVTLPIGCVFVVWCVRTSERYSELGVRFQTLNDYMSLLRIGTYEAESLERDLRIALRPRELDRPSPLRTIPLFLPEASENQLDSHLPHSGREYVPASLLYPDGEIGEVAVRYRGDHFWHWGGRKKSFRIKTKKRRLYERVRSLNISGPKSTDQVAEYISNELALDFGLIGPKSELVNLEINGRYRGIHLFVEKLEEMVLRTNGRMPGDLYAADIVRRNSWKNVPVRVFSNPGLWEKAAINNHFADDEDSNLRALIALTDAPPSQERTRALREWIDVEAFARFEVFRAMCQSFHYDNSHNQRLYYDPWRNVFLPVVWDPVGWHPQSIPRRGQRAKPDVVSSILDEVLFQDPEFLAARQSVVEEWFSGGGHERLMALTDAAIASVEPSLHRDPALGIGLRRETPTEVLAAQVKLRATIDQIARHLREDYLTPGGLEFASARSVPQSLRVEVSGRRALQAIELEYSKPLGEAPGARIAYLTSEGLQTVDVSASVETRGNRVRIDVPLLAQFVVERTDERRVVNHYEVTVAPATYDILLTDVDLTDNRLEQVLGLHYDGTPRSADRAPSIRSVELANVYDLVTPSPRIEPLVLSGEHTFEGVRTIERDVLIEPGTVLRMAPAASVIIEGRLTARGTPDAPIQVVPRTEGQAPWGTLAIRGSGADASSLRWVEMSLGSGHKEPRAEYSSMFSIHDVQDVQVEDCTFSDSKVVDDMVHAVYSTVRFDRCRFIRSLMDAVDIDISEAIVRDCEFIESGNDALDLMTSRVAAIGSRMIDSGDKGVSVGEDTQAMLFRCSMIDGEIGVQIKDRSKAVVLQCEVRGNVKGVDAYKKNWRYDSGGWGYVYSSAIESNGVQLGADKHSRIMVHDTYLSPMVESSKRLVVDETCDDRSPATGNDPTRFRFPDERRDAHEMFSPVWSIVRAGRRGTGATR